MDLRNMRVLVVGLGKTGEALARFLLNQGARVKISDKKTEEELGKKVQGWRLKGVAVETGMHRPESFLEADLIIPSPGVADLPELQAAREKGTKIISEIELAFHFLKGKIVGITGTNGKSTTATLAYKILKEAGLRAFLAGNIGTPLISFAEKSREGHIYVTEISSFQLALADKFKVPVAVFLNISLNHLDWHLTFEDYFAAKKRLLFSQTEQDIAILNRDDRLVWTLSRVAKSKIFGFTQKRDIAKGCFLKNDWLVLRDGKEKRLMKASEIPLLGPHNRDNVMAAALVGLSFGLSPSQMRLSIQTFEGLEHRLEKVLTIRGVDFINDSKATTVDAALKALQSLDKKIVLILGGRDKGADFSLLRKSVRKKVKKIILIGEAAEKIEKALWGMLPMERAVSLRGAVASGFFSARPGEIVLLAPACTSFDMFKNFEERGRIFKREVRRLANGVNGKRA